MKKIVAVCLTAALSSLLSITALAATNQTDSDVLGWITNVDQSEMTAGKVAEEKSKNEAVVDFAKEMVSDHSANLDMVNSTSKDLNITPHTSKAVAKEKKAGEKELAKLKTITDEKKFDLKYMQAMKDGHTQALDKINQIIANNKTEGLNTLLTSTKEMIAKHLEHANTVLSNLSA